MRRRTLGSPVRVTALVCSVGTLSIAACVSRSAASNCCGSVPSSQEPSLVMPRSTISYFSGSRLDITALAEASETSCSPERPPKIKPTRIFFFSLMSLSLSYSQYQHTLPQDDSCMPPIFIQPEATVCLQKLTTPSSWSPCAYRASPLTEPGLHRVLRVPAGPRRHVSLPQVRRHFRHRR